MNLMNSALERGQRFRRYLREFLSEPSNLIGACIFLLFVSIAIAGPLIAPYGANEQIYADARQAPSRVHWFGTDHLARDVFSRVLLGARSVLIIAGSGSVLAVVLGTMIGLVTGYKGGWLDELIMRFFDSLLSLPALLLALLLLGTLRSAYGTNYMGIGKGVGVVLVLVVVYTPIVARVVRSVTLKEKNKGYIEAAKTQGESLGWILFREILPGVLPALTVETALRFSYAIFLAASLGFLGVGVQPPNPDWGLMVKEARSTYFQVPWALYFPVGAISVVVVGVNLFADGIKRTILEAN